MSDGVGETNLGWGRRAAEMKESWGKFATNRCVTYLVSRTTTLGHSGRKTPLLAWFLDFVDRRFRIIEDEQHPN